jgi:hypothetical protein
MCEEVGGVVGEKVMSCDRGDKAEARLFIKGSRRL